MGLPEFDPGLLQLQAVRVETLRLDALVLDALVYSLPFA